MLTRFEVANFKNFDEKITLDLTDTNMYLFNKDCVKEGVVNKALVYGHNGVGKSNLGFAIFDIISHLTDKNSAAECYKNYLNISNDSDIAEFVFTFQFDGNEVTYSYGKTDLETLVYEDIKINGNVYASIDRRESSEAIINAIGAESLRSDLGESKISLVSYIKKNSVLEDNCENLCFFKFVEFVNGMLFFRSLDSNRYIGFQQGSRSLGKDIIENGNVKHFESFLNKVGIECKLSTIETSEQIDLAFDFNGKKVSFFEIASQGTKSLALFYYWYQRLKGDSKVTFLFVDEFDAFYHHALSSAVVELIRDIDAQSVITTHNTSIMSNELLRPDCYFLMYPNKISSLTNNTSKELREAHNIEKMYKAGAFSG